MALTWDNPQSDPAADIRDMIKSMRERDDPPYAPSIIVFAPGVVRELQKTENGRAVLATYGSIK